jgi:hypothetical protein
MFKKETKDAKLEEFKQQLQNRMHTDKDVVEHIDELMMLNE